MKNNKTMFTVLGILIVTSVVVGIASDFEHGGVWAFLAGLVVLLGKWKT